MKLAPVNGVKVCKLVFVPEVDVFSTCFNFTKVPIGVVGGVSLFQSGKGMEKGCAPSPELFLIFELKKASFDAFWDW